MKLMIIEKQIKAIYKDEDIESLSTYYTYKKRRDSSVDVGIPIGIFGYLQYLTVAFIRNSLSFMMYSVLFSPLLILNTGDNKQPISIDYPEDEYYVTCEFVKNIKQRQEIEEEDKLPPPPPTGLSID